jgi:hypothetical protein
MQRLLFVLVVSGIGVVGLGFYLGWFHIGSDQADGKSNVTLSVDAEKFREDRKSAAGSVQDLGRQFKDQVAGPGEKNTEGTFVSVNGDQLKLTTKDGKEHSRKLASNVQVTCDGKACTAADLKAGMRVRVTAGPAEPHAATHIEALDQNRDFEKGA